MKRSELKNLIRRIIKEQEGTGGPRPVSPDKSKGSSALTLGDAVNNFEGTSSCSQQEMMTLINNDRGLDMDQPVKATPAHALGYGILGCVLVGRYYGWW